MGNWNNKLKGESSPIRLLHFVPLPPLDLAPLDGWQTITLSFSSFPNKHGGRNTHSPPSLLPNSQISQAPSSRKPSAAAAASRPSSALPLFSPSPFTISIPSPSFRRPCSFPNTSSHPFTASHVTSTQQPLFHHTPTPPSNTVTSTLHCFYIFLCDVHQENPEILKTPIAKWREGLSKHYSEAVLRQTSIVWGEVELAAAPAAVVALPAVEVERRWFQLPTEDVFGEIERLWSAMIKSGNGARWGMHMIDVDNGMNCRRGRIARTYWPLVNLDICAFTRQTWYNEWLR
ncbi:hypothetical protein NC653_037120 [Populus alba x Populus x berolinensis]|uniref:Uncharacterized protein n=1 Tax=Populus alba x Populus x berolinensis TaxID=444605 RepID=A0AAD6LLJ5_9ROSI|nr:hypothetical protein NC653_037120 [Populus alba x Populus x berolinensis]